MRHYFGTRSVNGSATQYQLAGQSLVSNASQANVRHLQAGITALFNLTGKHLVKFFMTLLVALGAPAALAIDSDCGDYDPWGVDFEMGVSPLSERVMDAHHGMIIICSVIGIIVFGAMTYSIIFHRHGRREAAQFHHSTIVELIWTIIPIAILVGITIWMVPLLLEQEDTSAAEPSALMEGADPELLEITVTGYQWLWEYEYPDEGISFFSKLSERSNKLRQLGQVDLMDSLGQIDAVDNDCYLSEVGKGQRMVVPVGRKVLLKVTSADVIHSWSMDAFEFKIDANPLAINEKAFIANKTGVYRGWCKELCGADHAFMPIVVEVVEQAEYEAWVKAKQAEAAQKVAAAN